MGKSRLRIMMLVLTLATCLVLSGVGMASAATTQFNLYVNNSYDSTISSFTTSYPYHYSTKNNYGTTKYYTAKGQTLASILQSRGITVGNISQLVVTAADNYSKTFNDESDVTVQSLFNGTRKYYPSGGGTAVAVDTVIATAQEDYITNNEPTSTGKCLRIFMGQTGTSDVTNPWMVKYIDRIDVTT